MSTTTLTNPDDARRVLIRMAIAAVHEARKLWKEGQENPSSTGQDRAWAEDNLQWAQARLGRLYQEIEALLGETDPPHPRSVTLTFAPGPVEGIDNLVMIRHDGIGGREVIGTELTLDEGLWEVAEFLMGHRHKYRPEYMRPVEQKLLPPPRPEELDERLQFARQMLAYFGTGPIDPLLGIAHDDLELRDWAARITRTGVIDSIDFANFVTSVLDYYGSGEDETPEEKTLRLLAVSLSVPKKVPA